VILDKTYSFFSNNNHFKKEDPDYWIVVMINISLLLNALFCCVYVLFNLFFLDNYNLAIVNCTGIILSSVVLFFFHRLHQVKNFSYFTVFIVIFILIFNLHLNEFDESYLLWLIVVPIMSFFLIGGKVSFYIVAVFYTYIIFFIIIKNDNTGAAGFNIIDIFNIVFSTVSSVTGIYFFELSRRDNAEKLLKDISRRKDAEEEVYQYSKKLENAIADKDKFLSILAHDLRNPLGTLKSFIQLYYESENLLTAEEKKESLLSMKNSSEEVYNLLENLLEWSRCQRGFVNFYPTQFSLYTVISKVISINKPTSENKRISIVNDIPQETLIYADENMLSTIIRNLLTNALKFTPEGGYPITVSIDNRDNSKGVHILIIDKGIGMSKEKIRSLFRIDANISTPGTSKEKGSGLGLLLCKEYVKKHKGDIWAESVPGEGTTFHLFFPDML
jgi:signal transduction histidine kinase